MQRFDEYLRQKLKESGYRFTGQRGSILDVLIDYPNRHLSTEEVYNIIRGKNSKIGLATVYRTLMLLVNINIVSKIDFDDGISRYELIKENEEHKHHHLICSRCGSVAEVEDDLLEKLEKQILLKNKFLVKDHRVKFYGVCEKCISS